MAIDLYGTRFLAGLISTAKPELPGFWLNFFTRQFVFETEEIMFDQVLVDRKLAPFVLPTVAGVPQRERGYSTDKHRPAYVKPSHVLNPSRVIPRMPGEQIGGSMSLEARAQALLATYALDQRQMIERRWNWMAAQVMLTGAVTIAGEGYPTTVVDFGRPAGHTVTLGAGSRWGDAGISPLENLETWCGTVHNACGYPVDVCIMGTAAWTAFRKASDLKDMLLLLRATDRLGGLDIVPGSGAPLEYKGSDGARQYWVYSETYDQDETTQVAVMDPRDVLLVSTAGFQGAQCFGAILDFDNLRAQALFAKTWQEQNPSVRMVMTQSAPMMVPGRTKATFKSRVVA
jgi:Phage major capsid protein E